MKKIIAMLLMLLLIPSIYTTTLTGCDNSKKSKGVGDASYEEINGEQQLTATLIAVFPSQLNSEDSVSHFDYYYNDEITPEELADALSVWTGLDFYISASFNENGQLIVDWAKNSTLIANLDGREQKEEFFFFDADSMRWFMMDSLYQTLKEQFNTEVYYTMDGGKELAFEELNPVKVFPVDIPYMGSAFYFNHADVIGDDMILNIAFTLVQSVMEARGDEASVVTNTGEEIINGEDCLTFSAGEMSEDGEKFTAMYYYAVNKSWTAIYYKDVAEGSEWGPAAAG